MRVYFGWELDGARNRTSELGVARVGPKGFISLLETRLGLGQAESETTYAERVSIVKDALSQLLEQGHGAWFEASYRINSWSLARHLLRVRDFLTAYGWEPSPLDAIPADYSNRLITITQMEHAARQTPGWLTNGSNSAGQVVTALSERTWPLGIEKVTLMHTQRESLPALYRRILEHLESTGTVIEDAPASESPTSTKLLVADHEWEAASITATTLSTLLQQESETTVIAGMSTAVLDHELTLRGLNPLQVASSEQPNIVATFLRAMTKPHDVRSLLALLQTSFPAPDGGRLSLIRSDVAREFTSSLETSAGVGGAEWAAALSRFEAPEGATADMLERAQANQAVAHLLTSYIVEQPLVLNELSEESVDTEEIATRLAWLHLRLETLARASSTRPSPDTARSGRSRELMGALQQVTYVKKVITQVGQLTARELFSLVDSTVNSDSLRPLEPAAHQKLNVVTSPAQVAETCTSVVWWAPAGETVSTYFPLTSTEMAALTDAGFEIPEAQTLAELSVQAQLGALNQAHSVIVVMPKVIAGEPLVPNSLVDFLTYAAQEQVKPQLVAELYAFTDTEDNQQTDQPLPVQVTDPAGGIENLTLPATVAVEQPDPVEFTFNGGDHLLPEYLSHSQIDKLLSRPAEWLMRYKLGIKPSSGANVPSGNRMIGLFMHKLAENLHHAKTQGGQPGPYQVDESDIAKEFDRLVTEEAASLLLPGSYKLHQLQRATVIATLGNFYRALYDSGIAITAVESPLGTDSVTLTDVANPDYPQTREGFYTSDLKGRDGKPLLIVGFKDVEITVPAEEGRTLPGVIDLKYTSKSDRYSRPAGYGEATQLAIYARSLADSSHTMNDVPSAYFMLKDGKFFATHTMGEIRPIPKLRAPATKTTADAQELWALIIQRLEWVFADLRQGNLFDIDTLRALYGMNDSAYPAAARKAQKTIEAYRTYVEAEAQTHFANAYNRLTRMRSDNILLQIPNTYSDFARITGAEGDFS